MHPSPVDLPDRYGTRSLDRAFNAHPARLTIGVSPYGLASTFFSWGLHLMGPPGKQVQRAGKAASPCGLDALVSTGGTGENAPLYGKGSVRTLPGSRSGSTIRPMPKAHHDFRPRPERTRST